MIHEHQVVAAIKAITEETGYPPTPGELADALGVSRTAVHSALTGAKHAGEVRYDDAGRYVVVARDQRSEGEGR